MFRAEVGTALSIGGEQYRVCAHPASPSLPHAQEGRQSTVWRLEGPGGRSVALKVFKPAFRQPSLVEQADQLKRFSSLPGLAACSRLVISPLHEEELLRSWPDLAYAVLMPWMEGFTWTEALTRGLLPGPQEALALARSLLRSLVGLEERRAAHCDLSGPNLVVAPGWEAALVDLEQMFFPGAESPALAPSSSPGYGRPSSSAWGAEADRLPGAVLAAEILCLWEEGMREGAWGESFFGPEEVGRDCQRFRSLSSFLEENWGGELAGLFRQAWSAPEDAKRPPFSQWLLALPEGESSPSPSSSSSSPPPSSSSSSPPTVTSLSSLSLPPAWELARRAEELMRQGDEAGARELLEALAFREQASSSPPTVAPGKGSPPGAPSTFSFPAGPEPTAVLSPPTVAAPGEPAPSAPTVSSSGQEPPATISPSPPTAALGKESPSPAPRSSRRRYVLLACLAAVVLLGASLSLFFVLRPRPCSLVWKYQTEGPASSSPAVSGGTVFCGSWNRCIYALDAATGGLQWKYKTAGAVRSSPAVSGGTVFCGSDDGCIYALDAASGGLRWKHETEGMILSSPAVSGGTVFCGSDNGCIYALDAASGGLRWKFQTAGPVRSSPAVSGGTVFCGSDYGCIYAIRL